ncbi:MAG: DVUA0089 family protein [Hyphomonadaceae bacterium]|nr:DVUA0089 family protein [Hyphomonadaceae bacterium]
MRRISILFVLLFACLSVQASAQQRLTGRISAATRSVSFPVQLQANQIVTLTTSSSENFDTVLTLRNPGGRNVAENDDQEPGVLSSRVVYVAPAAGTYTAVVTGFGGATGAFELQITQGLDVGLSDAARTLREERVTLNRSRREMRYEINLAADDIFVGSTFALSENLDTTLSLLDASGAIIAQNDDRGDGSLNSQIIYQAVAAGRYTVVVSTYGGEGSGDLVLSLAIDPNAEAPFNFASIEGRQIARYEGELNAGQASREIPVRLTAGQTLLAVADVTAGNLDTVLRLNGPDGYPVALNDDRGDGSLNSAIAFTAPAAGTYQLILSRFQRAETSGAYRLVLSSVDAAVVGTLQALLEDPVTLSGPELMLQTRDFRVYYTLEGEDASSADYARSVADTLQFVLDAQTRMGFLAPVRDPDGRYRAYVADADGNMGYTKPVQIVFDNPNSRNVRESAAARGVFVIDNDFANMDKKAPTESLMRATTTHEFNHVVQYGYDSEEGLQWLYESTASWIETATVGADQDATDYVATDFAAPQTCWTTNEAGFDYAQWTLLQSLVDRYGQSIVPRLWQNSVNHDGLDTMGATLASVGANIPDALQYWRLQNFARDYALAPRFTSSVNLEGTVRRIGTWSTKDGIEQLGAHYLALGLTGRHSFALNGGRDLVLFGLGQRGNEIQVVPLGRGGVFDTTGFDYAGLMVFNRAVPSAPGVCSETAYTIAVTPATQAMAAPQIRFSAAHFEPPGE